MGISISLREDKYVSYFRENLLRLIETPRSDGLIICSGYISIGSRYSILDDLLLDAIVKNCKNVITVGAMFFNPDAKKRYYHFVSTLSMSGVNIHPFIAKNNKWHAKIAMKIREDKPVAALIGSSNLTAPAYRENYTAFNHECDVLIWENAHDLNFHFKKPFKSRSDSFGPMYTILDKDFEQVDESERLMKLYRAIKNNDFLIPFKL